MLNAASTHSNTHHHLRLLFYRRCRPSLPRVILFSSSKAITMLHEIIFTSTVVIPVANLENNRVILASVVVNKLLKQLSNIKACKYGYMIAVTKLISIGHGFNKLSPQHICIPVEFRCQTFMPMGGEIMTGIVHKVCREGVFLKCGPMKMVYLSSLKMPNYYYVSGETPVHMRDDLSRIEIGVVVRFVVYAVRWVEDRWREFRVLASLDGDGLGPVSLNGLDGIEM